MGRSIVIVVVLLLAAGGGWYAFGRGSNTSRAAGTAEGGSPDPKKAGAAAASTGPQVTPVMVHRRDVPLYLDGLGTVQAFNTVTVRPQIDGQLVNVAFKEGQDVKKGDLLAELDDRPYKAQLDEAVAKKLQDEAKKIQDQAKTEQDRAKEKQDIAKKDQDQSMIKVNQAKKTQDQANLSNAQVNLKRYVESKVADAVSEQVVGDQRSMVEQLQASVQGDEAAIQSAVSAVQGDDASILADQAAIRGDEAAVKGDDASIQGDDAAISYANTFLSYTKIASPIDGRTGVRQVDVGNIVHASASNNTDAAGLVVVTQIKPISVIFTLPQQDFARISTRMAKEKLPAIAVEEDGKTEIERGELELIDNQIDQTTGTIRLKGTFQNTSSRLWPGGFVNIRLLVETKKNATVVAGPAVQQGPDSLYVYVIKPDETVESRKVKVELFQDNRAIIAEGLEPGEKVVLNGQDRLKSGMKVLVSAKNKTAGGADNKTGDNTNRDANANPDGNAADNTESNAIRPHDEKTTEKTGAK
ncbi:MAG TPA: efflux RND transporter periplasmic adaptor subunit [Planctomycetota bacterium]|nr:efflux RND transporter periplasmic adaptor subunit [Planctomycetota bacterium]